MKNIAIVILLIVGINAQAQQKMTAELMWNLGRVAIEDVSANGDSILYGVKFYDVKANSGDRQLYLWTAAMGMKGVVQVTKEEMSISNGILLPGGKIGFLKGGQFYVKEIGGEYTVKKSKVDGAISIVKYSPDYSKVMYVKDVKVFETVMDKYPMYDKSEVLSYDKLMYMHWDHFEDEFASHVHYSVVNKDFSFTEGIDIMKGEEYDSPLQPFGGGEQISWSTDGNTIAYTSKKMDRTEYATSTNSEIYLYNISDSSTLNLSEGMMGYDVSPKYSPNGQYIAWLSIAEAGNEAGKNRIIVRDLESGKQMDLTRNYPETVNDFIFDEVENKIYFLSPTKGTIHYFSIAVPKKVKPKGKTFYKQITIGDHNYASIQKGGNFLFGMREDMNSPREIYRVDLVNGKPDKLTDVNGKISGVTQKSKIEKRWITTTDNKEMLTWVIYPPDFDPTKQYPALLYCQGGPQSTVSQRYHYRWNFQLMAAKGYIVIAPNRRGLPSFGEAWNDEISLDWGGQPIRDYISAVDSLVKEPFIDNARVGAVGASYGGYSVFYLAGMHEGRFKTFISHDGVFDLGSMYGTTEEVFFGDHEFGGTPWSDPQPKSYVKDSPHTNADKWDTPILIIHGLMDYRVPFAQSQYAYQVAQLKGIESKLLIFPKENHWVLKPQNSLIWHAEFYEWLDTYLK